MLKFAISRLYLDILPISDGRSSIATSGGIRMNVRKRDRRPTDMKRLACEEWTVVWLQSGIRVNLSLAIAEAFNTCRKINNHFSTPSSFFSAAVPRLFSTPRKELVLRQACLSLPPQRESGLRD